jgi:hypothetical protein
VHITSMSSWDLETMPEDIEATITCPYCDEPLRAPPEGAGVRCDGCGAFVMIDRHTDRPRVVWYTGSRWLPLLVGSLVRRWKSRGSGRL